MKLGLIAVAIVAVPEPVWGQALSFADLQGAVIESRIVDQNRVRHEGVIRHNSVHVDHKITIGPGDTITHAIRRTAVAPDGRILGGGTGGGSFELGKPKKMRLGNAVWIFLDGQLTFLGTVESGARRLTWSFKRSNGGLACSVVAAPWAREQGAGDLRTDAIGRPGKIEILESKVISSTCRIGKR